MTDLLFVDTSAWFAFANRKDPHHVAVSDVLHTFSGRLVTSNFVFDETVSLCLYRLGRAVASAVGDVLKDTGEVDLVRVTSNDELDAWELFGSRADQRYSFTDCTSFVLMRRLGLGVAAALDEDFATEGFSLVPVHQ